MTEGCNIFVAGQTGSGKSWFVKHRIAQERRLVVYLPKLEDRGYPGVCFDARAGQRTDFLSWWQHARRRAGRFRLVYRPADKFDSDEFDAICRLVYSCGDCTFVCEEISDYMRPGMFQATDRFQAIKDLLCAGRTRGVTAYWISQRPHNIPREVTSESRDAWLFQLLEPVDVKYIQERFGLETVELLTKLEQYQYVHWQLGEPPCVGKVE